MKKYILLFIALTVSLSSCKKFSVEKQNADDDAAIQAYLKAHNKTAEKDPSGLYFSIAVPGAGAHPTATSDVFVDYVGQRLDETTFDAASAAGFNLQEVIQGWQIGIPKIASGGQIVLYVPSSLAYGNKKVGALEKNTPLIFAIKLISFN